MKKGFSAGILFLSLILLICIVAIAMVVSFGFDVPYIPWVLVGVEVFLVISLVYYLVTSEELTTEVLPSLFGHKAVTCKYCTARFFKENEAKEHETSCVHRRNLEEGGQEAAGEKDLQYEDPTGGKPEYLQEQNKSIAEVQKWRREEDPSNNGSPRNSPRNQGFDMDAEPEGI